MPQEIETDASNQILGRLASKIAFLLRGKDLPDFAPNRIPSRKIIVVNGDKVKVSGKKMKQKLYIRHSGYLGHLKEIPFEDMMKRNPKRVLEWAVYGMLPKNKLRAKMMKNLIIKNGDHKDKKY